MGDKGTQSKLKFYSFFLAPSYAVSKAASLQVKLETEHATGSYFITTLHCTVWQRNRRTPDQLIFSL